MSTAQKPKYLHLCEQIVSDLFPKLSEGDKLPTTRQLCDRYEVSEITVNKALGLMAEQGLVTRTPGRGTIVTHHPRRPAQFNFAKRVATLTVLGIRDWRFTDAIETLLGRYRATNPHLTIEVTRASEAEYDALVHEGPYDLTLVNTWLMRQFITDAPLRRRFLPIGELRGLWFDEQVCFENVVRWCKADDEQLMCLPLTTSPVLGLVNPAYPGATAEAFAEAREPAALMDLLRRLRPDESPVRHYPLLLFMGINRWPILLKMLGGELFSADGSRCLIDRPETIAAMRTLVDLIHRDRVCAPLSMLGPSSVRAAGAARLFGTGKFAYTMVTHAETSCTYPGEVEYILLPQANQPFSHLHIEGVMIGRETEHAGEIRDFLNYLMVADNQLFLSEHSDGFSCQKRAAAAYAALAARRRRGFDRFLEQLPYAQPLIAAPCEQARQILSDRLWPMWLGVEEPAAACADAAEQINHINERIPTPLHTW